MEIRSISTERETPWYRQRVQEGQTANSKNRQSRSCERVVVVSQRLEEEEAESLLPEVERSSSLERGLQS